MSAIVHSWREGFLDFRARLGSALGAIALVGLAFFLAALVIGAVLFFLGLPPIADSLCRSLFLFAATTYLTVSFLGFVFKDAATRRLRDAFVPGSRKFLNYALLRILSGLLYLLTLAPGLILSAAWRESYIGPAVFFLLVPVVVWLYGRFLLADAFIVDRGASTLDALRSGWRASSGFAVLKSLGFSISAYTLNAIGLLFLGLGLLVTIPWTCFAYRALYRQSQS